MLRAAFGRERIARNRLVKNRKIVKDGIHTMARQTKRVRKNIHSAQALEEELSHADAPQPQAHKPWENIVLVVVICLTLFLLTSGWEMLSNLNRGMYSTLLVALIMMYAQRRAKRLTAVQLKWLNRTIFFFIFLSLVLFALAVYFDHFAG